MELNITINSYEGNNVGLRYVENACPGNPSIITFSPGLTMQQVSNAELFLNNWPQGNINDLPIASYKLDIDHSSVNMQSFGSTLFYNSSGQFFINYDQNSYNFWNSTDQNYETIVPNDFSRTGVVPFASSSSVSSSSSIPISPLIFLVVAGLISVAVVVIVIQYSKKNLLPKNKTTDNSFNSQGSYQTVIKAICQKCGYAIDGNDVFCQHCGERL